MSSLAYDPLTGLPKTKKRGGFRSLSLVPDYDPTGRFQIGSDNQVGTPAGSFTIPGFKPDYKALIENDPVFGQFRSELSAQGIANAAQRNAAIQRALAQFGLIPDLQAASQKLGFDLPADLDLESTRALAETNTQAGLSSLGRLQRQQTQNVRAIRNALAARGLLDSGELGYQLGENQQAYTEALTDAETQLLDYLAGVQSAFAQGEAGRARERAAAAGEAATRQAALPQNQPTADVTAVYSHTDEQGRPVYRSPDGRLYNPDGSPYTAPPQAPQEVPTTGEDVDPLAQLFRRGAGTSFLKAL